jgi:hypothetical protein
MHHSKTTAIIIIVVVVAFLIGVGILVGAHVSGGNAATSNASLSPYSAVYLSTGDVYFGILDWSPSPHIEDAWFLQHSTNAQGQPTIGVYPFGQVAWGPAGSVYFNSQQIIFWTRLSSTSTVAEAMANPDSSGVAQQGTPSTPSVTASSTTTSSAASPQ